MPIILSGIHTLDQHLSTLIEDIAHYRPKCCQNCGKAGLWSHGCYTRKARCEQGDGNPALIPRFLCPACGQTCSVLPEYIPPGRWYHWPIQQVVIWLLLCGNTYNSVLEVLGTKGAGSDGFEPGLSTLHRWWSRFRADYLTSRFCLCNDFPSLGITHALSSFWLRCLEKMRLSSAMALLFHAQCNGAITLHY
jgi:hypothetical protein